MLYTVRSLAPKLKKKDFDEVYEIASGRKFKSRAAPLAATPVDHVAVDHTILGSMVLGRFHLGFCLIPDYFHGHFCLGAGVCRPSARRLSAAIGHLRLFRISLSRLDKSFCLILDDLEKNYYEAGKNSETHQQGRERRLKGRIRMLVCTKNAVIRGIKVNMYVFKFCA